MRPEQSKGQSQDLNPGLPNKPLGALTLYCIPWGLNGSDGDSALEEKEDVKRKDLRHAESNSRRQRPAFREKMPSVPIVLMVTVLNAFYK